MSPLGVFLDGKRAFKDLVLDEQGNNVFKYLGENFDQPSCSSKKKKATCCVSVSFILSNKNAGRSTVAANSGDQIAISLLPKYLHFVGQKK